MVALIEMEKTQHDIAKQSKKECIFMLKSAIFKDPWSIHSNSNILSWEMSILTTITHILLAPSHFTWLMLLLFLHSYAFCFIHFSYWAHILVRQHFVCSISAMQKKPSNNKRKNRNRIIFDEMISIFARFVAGFFVFFSIQDIYVNLCHCYYTESN